ncbi:MAG: serine/threonine-protein kinase, partial [Gemmatimonadales bacterium]
SVWLARRTDGRYEGHAAVKLMNLALMTETGQERFRREGTALARLAHPAIARLLDAGVAPSGQPYLVIEYVDGERLDQYADAAGLSRDDRIRLVLQVLDAVSHAHANLIVHRDLKPSNLLVTPAGRVKLLDFGIAKLLQDEGEDDRTALTREAGSALTPDYASPEQIRGDPITTATDVYAIGVLLYLLLAGRHPTRGPDASPADSLRAILETEPRRLGLGDLDTIVLKALRKAPGERYQTAAAMADDLRHYLNHEPVSARPDSLAYRAGKFVRRNRVAVASGTLMALVLFGATFYSLVQARRATEQRDLALAESRRSSAFSEMQTALASDLRDADGQPLSSLERIAYAEDLVRRRFASEPGLVAEMLVDLAGKVLDAGDLAGAIAMTTRARTIAREAGHAAAEATASCNRGRFFIQSNQETREDSARADLADARAALARMRPPIDLMTRVICTEAEAWLLQESGQGDSGVTLLRQTLAALDSAGQSTYRNTIVIGLAEFLRLAGRPREALPYQLEVVNDLEETGYANTDQLASVISFVTASLTDLGEYRVEDSLLAALIRRREAGPGTARVPGLIAFRYGENKGRLGAADSADRWIAQATTTLLREDPTREYWVPPAVALLRLEQGRLAEARAAAANLARVDRSFRGMRSYYALVRARLLDAGGDRARAARLLEDELAAVYREAPKTLPHFALPLVTAGEWRLARGDAGAADSLARLAIAAGAMDSLALTRGATVGRAELLRSRALAAQGDSAAARAAAGRAAVALANGYGPDHAWTRTARELLVGPVP